MGGWLLQNLMCANIYSKDEKKLFVVKKDPYNRGSEILQQKKFVARKNFPYMIDITADKSVGATQFPQQTSGIDNYPFPCIAVPTQ